MCARRKTPAAAASLSPSNTVSGTLQIMAKQVNRPFSSAMATARSERGAAAERGAGDAGGGLERWLGGRGCAGRHGRPIQAAVRWRGPPAAARCRARSKAGGSLAGQRRATRETRRWDAPARGSSTTRRRLADNATAGERQTESGRGTLFASLAGRRASRSAHFHAAATRHFDRQHQHQPAAQLAYRSGGDVASKMRRQLRRRGYYGDVSALCHLPACVDGPAAVLAGAC
jgi:hypothetical protein